MGSRGPFLERPGNLTDQKSYFEIKVSRKVGFVLTYNEVHFVPLADNFAVQLSNLLKLRETGPWSFTFEKTSYISLGYKLVPVQYREYEYDLLYRSKELSRTLLQVKDIAFSLRVPG